MKILIAAIAALFATLFLAATPASAAEMKGALEKLQYLSTGVSLEARQAGLPAGYQAKLVFANPKGELYAGVWVAITQKGRKRTIHSEGPWLLLKGEPGEYMVRASAGEATGALKIHLPAKGMGTYVIHLKEPKKAPLRN
ncbi:MAG: hypothetical protein AABZ64_10525 [Nitrospinota bacterium]